MCGRFTIRKPVTKTVDIVKTNIKVEDSDYYNAHPAQKLPIIKSYTNGKALELYEWALVPSWSKKLDKISLKASQLSQRGGQLICKNLGERVQVGGQAILYSRGEFHI